MVKRLRDLPEVEARHLSLDRVVCPTFADTAPLLRELAAEGIAGSMARGHYSFMGIPATERHRLS